MTGSAYTARATIKAHVIAAIAKLSLPTVNKQYTHDTAAQFILEINRVLKRAYNPLSGQWMANLLQSSTDPINPSVIAGIKATDSVSIASVFKDSLQEPRKLQAASTTPSVPILLAIQVRTDAIDAADRQNVLNQAAGDAKEGATTAITKKVRTRVTDTVLRTADGTYYKSVDGYALHSIVTTVLQAANHPNIRNVRKQLSDGIIIKFNLRQRFADNAAFLQARVAHLATYGISVPEAMIATIILAKANEAAHKPWGRNIKTAVANLRRTYTQDYKHNAVSVAAILLELAKADPVSNMMAAPVPGESVNRAVAVNSAMFHVEHIVFDDTSNKGVIS